MTKLTLELSWEDREDTGVVEIEPALNQALLAIGDREIAQVIVILDLLILLLLLLLSLLFLLLLCLLLLHLLLFLLCQSLSVFFRQSGLHLREFLGLRRCL